MRAAYRVYYTEFERGWGSRPDGHRDFEGDNAYQEALIHSREYNAMNTEPTAPDWYSIASEPTLVDLDKDK